jgi:hypothetical protein
MYPLKMNTNKHMKDMKNPHVAFMLQSFEVSSFWDSFKIKNLINGGMSIFAAVLKNIQRH